uniref:Malonyl-[acyl-carrier protein] O-methyltransferase n=1 Tax=Candidatus Kentrum sp. DK TaxID=2126562 RepID=A0A450S4R3_9GAMM|nr:MAG: malonyl-CoA O-methyltransferase [Candidatus Kentron sp. DK]
MTTSRNNQAPNPPGARVALLDKKKVRESFGRAAPRYDEIAELQRRIGERLLAHLDPVPASFSPAAVLDVGAGTGVCLGPLEARYPGARVIALDLAEGMLREARRAERVSERGLFVCGDAERLPFRADSIDLLFSNVTVQWCNDLAEACREFARILRPGGLLVFSTFGPDTLWELRESWGQTDGDSHVNAFIDMHHIGDLLIQTGFTGVVMDREDVVCTYGSVHDLMRELKTLGAHNATHDRPRGLTGRKHLQAMVNAYERHRDNDRIPATYEVIHAYGRLPG